jgi:DNA-binding XRE family transcriptional regulator
MGYALRMSDEMHDWLTELGRGDRAAAKLVAGALTMLLSEGERLGPPLVVPLTNSFRVPDLAETLDRSYQRGLELLQATRRRAMDAGTVTRRIREQVASLDPQAATREQAGELQRQLGAATETEQRLTEQSIRLQGRADAFRTTKEVLKARYVAARAEAAAQEFLADADPDPGSGSGSGDRGHPGGERNVADSIRTIEQEMEQELRTAPWAQVGELGPAPGLMELRPGAPAASEVSILFAVEPPATVQLLSVLEGGEALRDYHDEAVLLSSELLQRLRAGQAPEAAAHEYRDTSSFLAEFFPGEAGGILASAGAVAAGERARTLAELRARLGLTQAQVAARMNVALDTVSAIEQAGFDASDVRTLADYIAALGGRLEIIADVGGDRVVLG